MTTLDKHTMKPSMLHEMIYKGNIDGCGERKVFFLYFKNFEVRV